MNTHADIRLPATTELISIDQAAAVAGCHRRTIERWLADGALPHYRRGRGRGRVLIDPADLELATAPRPSNPRGRPHRGRPSDRGFTLVELLTVVIVIGVLLAIAIPLFTHQKNKGYDAAVKADLASVAKAVEAAGVDGATGAVSRDANTVTVAGGGVSTVTSSDGVTWTVAGTSTAYCAAGWRTDSRGRYLQGAPLVYDSSRGGLVDDGTCDVAGVPADWVSGGGGGGGPVEGPLLELVYNLGAPGCAVSTITLPTAVVSGTGTVEWGDGASEALVPSPSHAYASGTGTVTVAVHGVVTSILSTGAATTSAPCLVSVPRWVDDENVRTVKLASAFYGASNLTAVATPPYRITGSLQNCFHAATAFNGDLSGWDVSGVTDLSYMFSGATAFNGDISTWDTSHVTTLFGTFSGATSFNGDLSRWDTSQVTTLYSTFNAAAMFDGDISGWNTGNVTTLNSTFINAKAFSGDISGWNTSQVTTMNNALFKASAFHGDLSGWDVTRVTSHTAFATGTTGVIQPAWLF